MTLHPYYSHQLPLICFAAGSLIHAVQTGLVVKFWRHAEGGARRQAAAGLSIGAGAFVWQFGNFFREFAQSLGFGGGTGLSQAGDLLATAALLCFPLVFSYMVEFPYEKPAAVRAICRIAQWLRYPLWPWTIAALIAGIVQYSGPLPINPRYSRDFTLHLMLGYFLVFVLQGIFHGRAERRREASVNRANLAALIASVLAAGMFILMLSGTDGLDDFRPYIDLAAMMTSVPFTIAVGYRLYQFPFMDKFVRESITAIILIAGFVVALRVGLAWFNEDLRILWLTFAATGLAFAKESLSRWVEKILMGYSEAIDEQEERVGNAIRALTRLDQFPDRVSEILRSELEAQWVEIAPEQAAGALHRIEIAGPSVLWLSLGPRVGGRQYMSRHIRLARTAALQLAAHHHQLSQHELRSLTARAQMQALQAQINPHFLFNTLNVLANLIHSNPQKAERLTEELAEIFRYALESTRMEWVKLEDELRFLESYLEIEKTRFNERLSYTFDIDPSLRQLRIPPMILQPLVENAIKHGIGPKVEGGSVRVYAAVSGGNIAIAVEDTGLGVGAKSRNRGSGIGLSNVRERLRHVYGDSSVLRLEELQPAGTRALLVLPQLTGVQL